MRSLILRMQITLDGFAQGPDGDMSWAKANDPEDWKDMFNMLDNVDLILLGSGVYPEYRDAWRKSLTSENATPNEKRYAELADKTQHVVFSKKMIETGWNNTTIFSGDAVEEVNRLKGLPGKNIYIVGGPQFASTLIDSGLVDEYILEFNPLIIAGGKSFFKLLKHKRNLKLKRCYELKSGMVILHYLKDKLTPEA